MKKIEFGFSNDQRPSGSWEGIGISQDEFITEGDYLGTIGYRDSHYIVCNVEIPDAGNRFIVREALYDLFADGSGILYLNQVKNYLSRDIKNYLNRIGIKENIKTIDDVIKLGNGLHGSNKAFRLLELDNKIISTSILQEVFEEKREAIKYSQKSISDLVMEHTNNYSM